MRAEENKKRRRDWNTDDGEPALSVPAQIHTPTAPIESICWGVKMLPAHQSLVVLQMGRETKPPAGPGGCWLCAGTAGAEVAAAPAAAAQGRVVCVAEQRWHLWLWLCPGGIANFWPSRLSEHYPCRGVWEPT